METSKLYSEILILVEEAEYEEIPNSALYKMDFEKAAKSIEQLLLDKMEDSLKWYQSISNVLSNEYIGKTPKELIQLYLNK